MGIISFYAMLEILANKKEVVENMKSSIDVDIWKDDFQLLNEDYNIDTRDNAANAIKHIAEAIMREREQHYMDTINYLLDILEEVVSEKEFQNIKKEVLSDE